MLWSAHPVSLLAKVYIAVSLSLLFLGGLLTAGILNENAMFVEVVLWVPRLQIVEPLERVRYEVNLAVLLAGWAVAVGLLLLLALRAPFRIRSAAMTQRKIRDLQKEVLDLRTLPLRQQEEDEILAAEAHLDAAPRKVMTEKIRLDRQAAQRAREGSGGTGQ